MLFCIHNQKLAGTCGTMVKFQPFLEKRMKKEGTTFSYVAKRSMYNHPYNFQTKLSTPVKSPRGYLLVRRSAPLFSIPIHGWPSGTENVYSLCVPACLTEVNLAVLNVDYSHHSGADNVPLEKVGNTSVTDDELMISGRALKKKASAVTIFCSQTISIGSHWVRKRNSPWREGPLWRSYENHQGMGPICERPFNAASPSFAIIPLGSQPISSDNPWQNQRHINFAQWTRAWQFLSASNLSLVSFTLTWDSAS